MMLADLHLPEDHDAMRQMVALSSLGQRDVKTWRHFQRNNNVIHVEVTVNRLQSGGAMAFVVLAYDVTERRNAVNALEHSEQRHRAIVQISADLIFLSCNDEIIFINEAGVRLLRASDSRQIIGRSPRDFISWDAQEFLNEIAMWDKPRTGAPTNVTMIADDGSHFEASARTVTYVSNGEVITQTTCFDLTAIRAADRKTHQDELRFQTVFNLQFQFMVILAPSGEILMVNDLPLEAGGINRDAVVGEIFWDTVWWRDLPLMRAQWPLMLAKAAGDTSALRFEGQFSTVSNEVRDIDVAITAVRDDAGVLSYFIFQANDITGRKADELALRAGEARLATAEERANVGSWEYDFGEGRTWWSDNMYRLTGAEPGTPPFGLIGFRNFVHVNDRKIFDNDAPFWEKFPSGFEFRSQPTAHRPMRHFELVFVLETDAEGAPMRVGGSIMDVTGRMLLQAQLQQAQRLEAIGQLTGGVAHDFNNLLTVILGNAEALVEILADRPDLRTLAEMILNAAERGADLTGQLLAFARRQPLVPQVVDVNALLTDMKGLIRQTLAEDIVFELTEGDPLGMTFLDETRLEAAILNLVLNARDAMQQGGRLTIETSNARLDPSFAAVDATAEHYILISVTDTGEGMTREVADRAFEPFYTTKKTDRNSGLGLSMIHGFIKQSGGQVVLLSEPGFGTTIRLYLPRAPQGAALSAPSAAPPELAHGSETILVVEDDPLVRSHVLSRLAQLGYFVLEAANGHDALIILASDIAIDLLFTDVVMPGGLNGRELAIKANALRPELPVLFTSGYTENTIVHDGRLDEDVHLLSKPYRLQDLAAKIREVLFIARRAAPEPMPPLIN